VKRNESRSRVYRAAGALLLLAVLVVTAQAQQGADVPRTSGANRWILVSIPDRELAVLEGDRVIRTFPVTVGASDSPSPTGDFRITNRVTNPTYYHPGVVIPAGRNNPIGPRWIGLNRKGYGIHGTNEPRSVGKAASHGCIRLRNGDIKLLFAMVSTGDAVEIRAERDQQTAEVFGSAPAAKNVQLARTQPPAVSAGGGQ
jgi:lipoprotein-anchoring transpeptidase ErfK/SrfK